MKLRLVYNKKARVLNTNRILLVVFAFMLIVIPFTKGDTFSITNDINDLTKDDISSSDCILCLEVFEHLVNPLKMLDKFKDKLKNGQYLIISESCEYIEDFSSHLKLNEKYSGNNFIKLMEDYGFSHIKKDPFIPQLFFEKLK